MCPLKCPHPDPRNMRLCYLQGNGTLELETMEIALDCLYGADGTTGSSGEEGRGLLRAEGMMEAEAGMLEGQEPRRVGTSGSWKRREVDSPPEPPEGSSPACTVM